MDRQEGEGFREIVKSVIPTFWVDEMANWTKKRIISSLATHLQVIDEISMNTRPNTLNFVDMSNLPRIDVLKIFLRVDQTQYFDEEDRKQFAMQTKVKQLMEFNGVVMPVRTRYQNNWDSDLDESDSEGETE